MIDGGHLMDGERRQGERSLAAWDPNTDDAKLIEVARHRGLRRRDALLGEQVHKLGLT